MEDAPAAPRFGLFEVFGVEIEYMLVDATTLDVRPAADRLLQRAAGLAGDAFVGEVDRGPMAWSNELARHLIEFKTNGPTPTLASAAAAFQAEVVAANALLTEWGLRLMPTAMHPWMDPARELELWPHAGHEIYATYDRIFDCRRHGWANLQSCHLNLSFATDEEFGRLHAAVRLLLPLLPALAASSPILDGAKSRWLDSRMEVYRDNAARVPSIAGLVAPEAVFTEADYRRRVLQPAAADIRPLDPARLLQPDFLNSRGAIARFDRGAIEIRVLDCQECPAADIAVAQAAVAVLQALTEETWTSCGEQQSLATTALAAVLQDVIRDGEQAPIRDARLLAQFGLQGAATAGEMWRELLGRLELRLPELETILDHGPLARRLLAAVGADCSRGHLVEIYRELSDCLAEGRQFAPGSPP